MKLCPQLNIYPDKGTVSVIMEKGRNFMFCGALTSYLLSFINWFRENQNKLLNKPIHTLSERNSGKIKVKLIPCVIIVWWLPKRF